MSPRPRVVLVDGVPMSGLVALADDTKAVVVAFHGGASTAAYFDCPAIRTCRCSAPERPRATRWSHWTGLDTARRRPTPMP
jgi:hypothetical protein